MAEKVIRVTHPDISQNLSTVLSANVSSGSDVTLSVANNGYGTVDALAENDFVVIGQLGQGKTELAKINAAVSSPTSMQVDALRFAHPAGTPITQISYDKVALYSSTSETGTYSAAVAATELSTQMEFNILRDSSGTSTTWYKYIFYNSQEDTYSDYSDPFQAETFGPSTLSYIKEKVRFYTTLFSEQRLRDRHLVDLINIQAEKVMRRNQDWWFARKVDTITTSADQTEYTAFDDFRSLEKAIYNKYESSSNHTQPELEQISWTRFLEMTEDQNLSSSDELLYISVDPTRSYFYIYPPPETAGRTIYIYYFQNHPTLEADGDTTIIPDPMILVHLCCVDLQHLVPDININRHAQEAEAGIRALFKQQDMMPSKKRKGWRLYRF